MNWAVLVPEATVLILKKLDQLLLPMQRKVFARNPESSKFDRFGCPYSPFVSNYDRAKGRRTAILDRF
jgi:hypothetical protein